MRGSRPLAKRALTGVISVLLATSAFLLGAAAPAVAAPAPVAQRPASGVTADALPTVQINGVVWDQLVVGDTVYVGGTFTSARPAGAAPGTSETPRSNLLAYNLRTGALITSFAPVVNGPVRSLATSPDKTRLYIGGTFSQVNGANRYRLASFVLATGALTSFQPAPNTTVNGIAVTDTAVYAAGSFTKVGAVDRLRLAAFNPTTGALLSWAPTADATAQAVLLTPDGSRIIVAGAFGNLNGATAQGLGALDPVSAVSLPWAANTVVRNYGASAAMLKLRTDGQTVYAAGYWFGGAGNFEGVLAAEPNSGNVKWLADCHGDTYDVAPMNDSVYAVSHWHHCENAGGFPDTNPRSAWYYANAMTKETTGTVNPNNQGGYGNFAGQGAPTLINWYPTLTAGTFTGQSQAAWSATSTNEYLLLGGEFPTVNGVAQQGLVRFAVPAIAPKKQGPRVAGAAFNPSLVAIRPTELRINWQANHDRDDATLTYELTRVGTATPTYTTTANSTFWNRPAMGTTETGLTPGQTYRYRLTAKDADGNLAQSEAVTITMPTSVPPYVMAVLDDGASNYWRLNGGGSSQADYAGTQNQTSTGTTTAPGALAGDSALKFPGTSAGQSGTTSAIAGPTTFTAEAWFNTSTTSGGKIVGFGDRASGESSNYDRHVYMDNSGRITFGVHPGSVRTLRTAKAYNDGAWHHVVASLSSAGTQLYLDGVKVAGDASVTGAQEYSGYWRIGGDRLGGWPDEPSSSYFNGSIDEVAIYPTGLSGAQVRDHYTTSGRSVAIPAAPTDAYGKAVYADDPALYWRLNEGSGSTAVDVSPNMSDGTYNGGVSLRASSPVSEPLYGAAFNGSDGFVASNQQSGSPRNYSTEIWFNTTSTAGGKLIGFGCAPTGTSGCYDRHVYMDDTGKVTFGVWTGAANTITTAEALNDGRWHHAVATQSSVDGMRFYVDGRLVGSNPQTGAQDYAGYWRVGGDNHWGCCSPYLAGTLDEAAVYDKALTGAQVQAHYQASPAATTGTNAKPVAAFSSECVEAQCSFDSGASRDSDGTIAARSWDFGDGSTQGTGTNPTHAYEASGTYTVTLTVTDDKGATGTLAKDVVVTVPAGNQDPVAAFTSVCTGGQCSFDSSGSRDPDGTVASRSWDFGDGSPRSTSASPTHGYAASGTYTVTLTVTDDKGATGTVAKDVVVTVPVANQEPVAAFTVDCVERSCAFNSSGSKDPDGTLASFAWSFGDGASSTEANPTHRFSADGTYAVKLTVTDNGGVTNSVTKQVAVTTTPAGPIAADSFSRTVTRWGSAETGGAYTYSGSTFATTGSKGTVRLASPGTSATASLASVSARDVNVVADFSMDKLGTGGGTYNSLVVRRVGSSDYRVAFREQSGGTVSLTISRTVDGASTVLRQLTLPGVTHAAGDTFRVRFQVSGNGTTTLNAKAWKLGTTEPGAAQVSATDTTAALQTAGSFQIVSYLSGSSTNAPVTVSVDNLSITAG